MSSKAGSWNRTQKWFVGGAFAFLAVIVLLVTLPGDETGALDLGDDDAAPQVVQLDDDAAAARLRACLDQRQIDVNRSVIVAGGVRPLVRRDVWRELRKDERDAIFASAACIASNGFYGEQFITVASEFDTDIDTRRVANGPE